jgi:DnaJ-class molecular chaperone
MIFQTKFEVGDFIYHLEQKQTVNKISCVSCGGSGEILPKNGGGWDCPVCGGSKYVEAKGETKWVVSSVLGKIFKIKIYSSEGDQVILYMISGRYDWYKEVNCFISIESAQKECEIRNNTKYDLLCIS